MLTTNDGEHKVFAPYDGSLIATATFADKIAVETALENAYSLFRNRDAWLKPVLSESESLKRQPV